MAEASVQSTKRHDPKHEQEEANISVPGTLHLETGCDEVISKQTFRKDVNTTRVAGTDGVEGKDTFRVVEESHLADAKQQMSIDSGGIPAISSVVSGLVPHIKKESCDDDAEEDEEEETAAEEGVCKEVNDKMAFISSVSSINC